MSTAALYRRIQDVIDERLLKEKRNELPLAPVNVRQVITLMGIAGLKFRQMNEMFNTEIALWAFLQHKGNQCAAAKELGMHRNTFSRWLRRWMDLNQVTPSKPRYRAAKPVPRKGPKGDIWPAGSAYVSARQGG